MFDFSHLPNVHNGADIQVFKTPGVQPWYRPRGKSSVTMLVVGSGSGGGAGFSGAAGTARGGGGGGASSSIAKLTIAMALLPDILFCHVAAGGAGGVGAAGGNGDYSAITLSPNNKTDSVPRVVYSGGSSITGGGLGSATAAGAAGNTGAVATVNNLSVWGNFLSNAGQVGAAGGAQTGTVGLSITGFGANMAMGGAGGAGVGTSATEFVGGGINASAPFLAVPGGAVGGGRGQDGYERNFTGLFMPIGFQASISGTGGGSSNAGTGGAGGNGGIGSGGGGGGAGVTGGRGGNGGHGMIVIVSM